MGLDSTKDAGNEAKGFGLLTEGQRRTGTVETAYNERRGKGGLLAGAAMSELSRREAVKLAAGLAVGAGAWAGQAADADENPPVEHVQPLSTNDAALEQALRSPAGFMFSQQVSFKLEGDGYSRELVITSAKDAAGKPTRIFVRSATMQILRADAGLDDFTRKGGVYWQFFNKAGTFQFKEPGALVMIVREHDDTVRCYSLAYDERC